MTHYILIETHATTGKPISTLNYRVFVSKERAQEAADRMNRHYPPDLRVRVMKVEMV